MGLMLPHEEHRVWVSHREFQPLGPAMERQAPKISGFRNQWGLRPGNPRAVGISDTPSEGLASNLTHPDTQHGGNS